MKKVYRHSLLYSTEYDHPNGLNPDLHNYDAPCAVCYVKMAAKVMIPGNTECPNSWTMEYNGYLMSNAVGPAYASSKTYVCVDGNAEYIQGSDKNTDGALFFHAVVDCKYSFLPCEPYKHFVPLTCVVCTD